MILRFEEYQPTLVESAVKLLQGSRVPVSLRPICRQLSVHSIRREKLEGSKSLLIDARVKPVIILNRSRTGPPAERNSFNSIERFLIAHELGHLVLQQHGAKNPSGKSEYWKLEKLCDAFARRLLLPDAFVMKIDAQTGKSATERLRATFLLAKRSVVPWSAAALRLAEVNEGTKFFHLVSTSTGDFKIVVSSCPNHLGRGQKVRAGTVLHQTLSHRRLRGSVVQEIEGSQLSGIAGIKDISSGAAFRFRGGVHLAIVPA